MRRQPGYSLIECVAAIGLTAVTFATVAVAMNGLYRSSQQTRDRAAAELEMERFATQFRADAHQARGMEETDADPSGLDGSSIVLSLPGNRSIQYVLSPGRIERVLYQDKIQQHRETYRLPESAKVTWRIDRERFTPIVSLVVEPAGHESNPWSDFQAIQIDAAVGLLRPILAPDS